MPASIDQRAARSTPLVCRQSKSETRYGLFSIGTGKFTAARHSWLGRIFVCHARSVPGYVTPASSHPAPPFPETETSSWRTRQPKLKFVELIVKVKEKVPRSIPRIADVISLPRHASHVFFCTRPQRQKRHKRNKTSGRPSSTVQTVYRSYQSRGKRTVSSQPSFESSTGLWHCQWPEHGNLTPGK